jgi:hypothetical protein
MKNLASMQILINVLLLLLFSYNCNALIWPTSNPAFANGKSIEAFVQATVSGNPSSGMYGLVRNKGKKFHEGLDLFGIKFNEKKEVLDSIFAVLPGKVVYINENSNQSKYGLYVVLLHKEAGLKFYSLYAHLDSIDGGLRINHFVAEGDRLGRMGNSAGGYTIPKNRAHLHFEIGLQLSDNFQSWFKSQSYETKNWHKKWNGMNLLGVDPLDFYRSIRTNQSDGFKSYLESLPHILAVRVRSDDMPFFIQNNPSFLETNGLSKSDIEGWEITFSRYGVPVRWKALDHSEVRLQDGVDIKIIRYNPNYDFGVEPVLFYKKDSELIPSNTLLSNIEKIFF